MGRRNIRPPLAGGGPSNFSGEAPFRTDWTIFSGKTEADGVHKISPPHARARAHSHTTLNTLHVCTPARPRPDWEITGGFVGPSSVGAGRIGGTGRSGRAPLRLEVSTIQSSSQGPVCKARPKAPYIMSSRGRHTGCVGDWSSDVCSTELAVWAMPTRTRSVDHGLARPPKILCVSRD